MGTAAAVLAAAFTSCVSNEVTLPVSEDIPITYSVLQKSMATRAAVTGTTYPQGVPFGSFAYYLPAGKTWRDNKADAQIYIDNNKVKYDATGKDSFASNSWHSDIVHYWPKAGSLTFFSYSPYDVLQGKISCSKENGLKIESWTAPMKPGNAAEGEDGVDLMIAKSENQTGNTSSVGGYQAGVPTAFKHILCQIEVKAKLNNPDENADYVINSITLSNIWTEAAFSNESWNSHRGAESVTYNCGGTDGVHLNTDGKTSSEVFPAMVLIPQNRKDVSGTNGRGKPSIKIGYSYKTDKNTQKSYTRVFVEKQFLDIDGLNQSWNQGKKYILTIAFSTQGAFLEFDTEVNGWNDGTGVDIMVGN